MPGCTRGALWWQRLNAHVETDAASPRLVRALKLLSEWLLAAEQLPAHDLLDRVFHEGEVLARYRLAVSEAAAASVVANLQALLLLALDLDGGRYRACRALSMNCTRLRDVDAQRCARRGRK